MLVYDPKKQRPEMLRIRVAGCDDVEVVDIPAALVIDNAIDFSEFGFVSGNVLILNSQCDRRSFLRWCDLNHAVSTLVDLYIEMGKITQKDIDDIRHLSRGLSIPSQDGCLYEAMISHIQEKARYAK